MKSTSNWKGTLSNGGNLYEVTDSSTIDSVAGTTWEGTRLTALNDGGNCGRWDNKLNNMASSGGVAIVHWGRLSSGAGNNPLTFGSFNTAMLEILILIIILDILMIYIILHQQLLVNFQLHFLVEVIIYQLIL